MPKGYIVLDIDIHDAGVFDEYRKRSIPYATRCGGKYLIATSEFDERETPFGLHRLVILEFENIEAARNCLGSDEYRTGILPFREKSATSKVVIVEGRD